MDKLIFKYDYDGQVVAQFDSESQKFKELINIAINELEKVKKLKGNIYNCTLSPSNIENFKDDMKTLMGCDVTIRTLKNIISEQTE